MFTPENLDLFFSLVLFGAKILHKQGRIYITEAQKQRLKEFQETNDVLELYVRENYIVDKFLKDILKDLQDNYDEKTITLRSLNERFQGKGITVARKFNYSRSHMLYYVKSVDKNKELKQIQKDIQEKQIV